MHRRLLTLTHDTRLPLFLTILSGLLAGLLTIWQSWLLSSVINNVFLQGQSLAQVMGLLQLILVAICGRAFLTWLNEIAANAVAVKIKTDLRNRLFAHILKLGPAYARGQRTGELTAAAVEGVEALDAYCHNWSSPPWFPFPFLYSSSPLTCFQASFSSSPHR
jgi:ATP-binding cassette subfamily C protein CydD